MSQYLDTRDLQTRLDELIAQREAFVTEQSVEDSDAARADAQIAWEEENPDEAEELSALESLKDELSHCWDDGETLIPSDEWVAYAEQTAEDIGAIEDANAWPCTAIDWQKAADQLAADYSTVDFRGETYYYRS